LTPHLNTQDFAGLAFDNDFEWPATDFAIGRKSLRRNAGINHEVEALAAKWALDGFGNFHVAIISHIAFVASLFSPRVSSGEC
jgi:hypothetical protein